MHEQFRAPFIDSPPPCISIFFFDQRPRRIRPLKPRDHLCKIHKPPSHTFCFCVGVMSLLCCYSWGVLADATIHVDTHCSASHRLASLDPASRIPASVAKSLCFGSGLTISPPRTRSPCRAVGRGAVQLNWALPGGPYLNPSWTPRVVTEGEEGLTYPSFSEAPEHPLSNQRSTSEHRTGTPVAGVIARGARVAQCACQSTQ